jgi:hypothetical protein
MKRLDICPICSTVGPAMNDDNWSTKSTVVRNGVVATMQYDWSRKKRRSPACIFHICIGVRVMAIVLDPQR